jgi:hypothetical protein
MLARRSFMRQTGVGGEQLPEPSCLAVDDGVSRRFECGYGRVGAPQFSYVPGKLRPTFESVFASDEKLSAGERTLGCFSRRLRDLAPVLLHQLRLAVAFIRFERSLAILEPRESFHTASSLLAEGSWIARFACVLEIPGELYCSRLGRGGKGIDIRNSFHCMPGIRTNQAERRFVAFGLGRVGGHGPFRGLDAPLALLRLYHDRLRCVDAKPGRIFPPELKPSRCDRACLAYDRLPPILWKNELVY